MALTTGEEFAAAQAVLAEVQKPWRPRGRSGRGYSHCALDVADEPTDFAQPGALLYYCFTIALLLL
jgi:hypothetical protein